MSNKEFQVRHGLVVNNNVLVANTVTGNVGIGTASPGYALDVFGTINAANVLMNGGPIAANLAPAFNTANSAYTTGNAAFTVANAAFAAANNVAPQITPAFDTANNAYLQANTAYNFANGVATNAAAAFAAANNVAPQVTPAFNTANAAFAVANAAYGNANTLAISSNNYAGVMANSANAYANNTYVKLTAAQQTITGDVAITGNLTFLGNSVVISSNSLSIGDSLIYLAANNYSGTDILDIGFIANYGNTTGANVHTGLIRDATNKQYYLFNGYDAEPANNTFVPGDNNMVNAVLIADVNTSNLTLGGANSILWIRSSYDTANAAYTASNGVNTYASATYSTLVQWGSSFGVTNSAYAVANAAFNKANNAGGGYFSGNNGDVGGTTGQGDIFRVHSNTMTQNVTIYSGNNALAAGPITVSIGKILAIQPSARLAIV